MRRKAALIRRKSSESMEYCYKMCQCNTSIRARVYLSGACYNRTYEANNTIAWSFVFQRFEICDFDHPGTKQN